MIQYWIIVLRFIQSLSWKVSFGGNKIIQFNCLCKTLDLKYSLSTAADMFCMF